MVWKQVGMSFSRVALGSELFASISCFHFRMVQYLILHFVLDWIIYRIGAGIGSTNDLTAIYNNFRIRLRSVYLHVRRLYLQRLPSYVQATACQPMSRKNCSQYHEKLCGGLDCYEEDHKPYITCILAVRNKILH